MGNRHCEAFGDSEIPSVVFYDVLTHNVPVQGDNGVLFEHKNNIEELLWVTLFCL